jgi:ABC-type Fe3+-hydroxamate transport system substrate-binding protein
VATFEDALGQSFRFERPPTRIVSLVPSETESVVELVGVERLVGRTEFCVEPSGVIEAVTVVGGTKKFDPAAVQRLAPDLVLANKEENGRSLVESLIRAGVKVHVSFPCGVVEAVDYVETLGVLLGAPGHVRIDAVRRAFTDAQAELAVRPAIRVFVPIWRDPWMTFDGRTFASDLLSLVGGQNIFSDRPRRYPLAADLGRAPPLSPTEVGERDTRYPRITLDEVRARGPDLVLLPDEPYAFTEIDAETLRDGLGVPVARVDGKALFWYGTRLAESIGALARCLALGP